MNASSCLSISDLRQNRTIGASLGKCRLGSVWIVAVAIPSVSVHCSIILEIIAVVAYPSPSIRPFVNRWETSALVPFGLSPYPSSSVSFHCDESFGNASSLLVDSIAIRIAPSVRIVRIVVSVGSVWIVTIAVTSLSFHWFHRLGSIVVFPIRHHRYRTIRSIVRNRSAVNRWVVSVSVASVSFH